MKKFAMILAAAGLILGASGVAEGDTILEVDPPSQEVMQGAAFDVDVYINNIANCRAVAFVLNFDNSAMEGTGITGGTFLQSGGGTILSVNQIRNEDGEAIYGCVRMIDSGVTGSGLLSTITFTVDASAPLGTYDLTFSGVEFMTPNYPYTEIPIDTVIDGTVTVIPEPGTVVLLVCGLAALLFGAVVRRRRRRA